ncbi:MAG TPA: winged helix-turn-helix domain-containing protein [Paludibacteraceae bacterium]|jgi:ArsR family transcriptional regulator|nr:winged helix-turn-helix domain-containing protein [Paludibacteraceae bacterium]
MAYLKNHAYDIDTEELARFAKAMGHPARISILRFLSSLDSCFFGDICQELPIAKATVSQHLTELKNAGLIRGEIEPPKVRYCIDRENWDKANEAFRQFFANIQSKEICCNLKN